MAGLLFVRWIDGRPGSFPQVQRHLMVMVSRWSWLWVLSTLLWLLFTASDLIGVPLAGLTGRLDSVAIAASTQQVLAAEVSLWVGFTVGWFGHRLRTQRQLFLGLLLTLAALLPTPIAGHASHHDAGLLISVLVGFHIVALAVWVGGLLVLATHLRAYPETVTALLPAFSRIALICVAIVGGSGLAAGFLTLADRTALWSTPRGQLVVAKAVALVVLVGLGWLHRRRSLPRVEAGDTTVFFRLAGVEVVVMGMTLGLGVALSTTG